MGNTEIARPETMFVFNSVSELKEFRGFNLGDHIRNQGTLTAKTLGYFSPGDGGGAEYRFDGTSNDAEDGGFIIEPINNIGNGRWLLLHDQEINVRSFGVIPGRSDNSIKLRELYLSTIARRSALTALWGNNRTHTISWFFPNGRYEFLTPQIIHKSDGGESVGNRIEGLTIRGQSYKGTQLLFNFTGYSGSDELVALYIVDSELKLTFENLDFRSNNVNNHFWASSSRGGTQMISFNRCSFGGSWRHVFHLMGSAADTVGNDVFSFNDCHFEGGCTAFLFIANAANALNGRNANDLFTNFNFHNFSYSNIDTATSGHIIRSHFGGHFTFTGRQDWSRNSGNGHLFHLLQDILTHGGARYLVVNNARVEHLTNSTHLIYCEWPDGLVVFDNLDQTRSTLITGTGVYTSGNAATFVLANTRSPNIEFRNCKLALRHLYTPGESAWQHPKSIRYVNCEFITAKSPDEFIVTTGISNRGGDPPIVFTSCKRCVAPGTYSGAPVWASGQTISTLPAFRRNSDGCFYEATTTGVTTSEPFGFRNGIADGTITWNFIDTRFPSSWLFDSTHNSIRSISAEPGPKTFHIKNALGQLPIPGDSLDQTLRVLPLNTLITGAELFYDAGGTTETDAVTYFLEGWTRSGTSWTTLATFNVANPSLGGSAVWTPTTGKIFIDTNILRLVRLRPHTDVSVRPTRALFRLFLEN